jgi:hypothetical protein
MMHLRNTCVKGFRLLDYNPNDNTRWHHHMTTPDDKVRLHHRWQRQMTIWNRHLGCNLGFHLVLSSSVIVCVLIWCCLLWCHLTLSSGVVLIMSSGVVILCCHMGCYLGCHLGFHLLLSSCDVIWVVIWVVICCWFLGWHWVVI